MTPCGRPRLELGVWPTPLLRARRLEARLGCGPLLVKRDDLSGFALAGNKARPLEYLLGGAQADGCTTVVVGGVATSNFCQAAAVAARAAGLDCHIVLPGSPPATATANLAVALACGAQLSFSGGPREELDERIRDRAAELTVEGRTAVGIPRGGATALGSLGFVRAAQELAEQLAAHGYDRARIVLAVGSGASIAGLLVGASLLSSRWTITGVSVSRPLPALLPHLGSLVEGCAELVGVPPPGLSALLLQEAPGGLHGAAGADRRDADAAAVLALESEGLVLDADYTAPAFHVAVRQLSEAGPPVVFWHTGGLAGAIGGYLTAGNGIDTGAVVDSRSGGRS
jgi:1-aminocyclopropane-1-carboxylate deaminase/D-cysteine desulfhydrase-like pyridoxal-dependent ACC family enzyme